MNERAQKGLEIGVGPNAKPEPEPAPKAAPRVVVVLDGGLVQDVLADVPVDCVKIDYDTEGADRADLWPVPQDGTEGDRPASSEAFISHFGVEVSPERVALLFLTADDKAAHAAANETCIACGCTVGVCDCGEVLQ